MSENDNENASVSRRNLFKLAAASGVGAALATGGARLLSGSAEAQQRQQQAKPGEQPYEVKPGQLDEY